MHRDTDNIWVWMLGIFSSLLWAAIASALVDTKKLGDIEKYVYLSVAMVLCAIVFEVMILSVVMYAPA